jgi:hypothetical protein
LVTQLRLTDSDHRSETVDLEIDGVVHVAGISGARARVVLNGQTSGQHRVRLVEPAACVPVAKTTCN